MTKHIARQTLSICWGEDPGPVRNCRSGSLHFSARPLATAILGTGRLHLFPLTSPSSHSDSGQIDDTTTKALSEVLLF